MNLRQFVLLGAAASAAASVSAQTIQTYTEGQLGYPVPVPINNTLPGSYFRTYSALETRHMELWLTHDHVERTVLGQTIHGRDIIAYTLSDTDDLTPDGAAEGGVLVNGTIHAREWASPEIVSQTFDWLVTNYGSDPVATFLQDNLRIVLIPVSNVDGFLHTQRTPTQHINSREGRQRRKNMRNADEELSTVEDAFNGVDLNRNFPVGWGLNFGSSSSPTSDIYRGPAPLTEPESLTIANYMNLFVSPAQLRFYADIHGAIPALYTVLNGAEAADAQTNTLSDRMRQTYISQNGIASSYSKILVEPGDELGATDEYFGNTYKVPSFTIEYPTPNYRDGGPMPNVFLLPEDEVGEVVQENRLALLLAFFFAAGPPILERVTFWEDRNGDSIQDSNEVAFELAWSALAGLPSQRARSESLLAPLEGNRTYRVRLQFSKPMRVDAGGGAPANWPGQSVPMQPAVTLDIESDTTGSQHLTVSASGQGWSRVGERYAFDSWEGIVTVPDSGPTTFTAATLRVHAQDFYGFQLDPQPQSSATWNAGWQGYEGGTLANPGGEVAESLPVETPSGFGSRTWWRFY